jgi:hypothetical protein
MDRHPEVIICTNQVHRTEKGPENQFSGPFLIYRRVVFPGPGSSFRAALKSDKIVTKIIEIADKCRYFTANVINHAHTGTVRH